MSKRCYGTVSAPVVLANGRKTPGSPPASRARRGVGTYAMVAVTSLLLLSVSVMLLVFAFAYDNREYADIQRVVDEVSSAANTPSEAPSSEQPSSEPAGPVVESLYSRDPMYRELNWDGIMDINDGVASWLYIPGMPIDYAVMEEPYSMDGSEYFYLRHDIYGERVSSGWIFSVKAPGNVEDMHSVIFGHNMGSGKEVMFGTLQRFKDEDFRREHPYVYLYYKDRTERWAVWATCNIKGDDIIYYMPYEKGSRDYGDLIDWVYERAEYDTGVAAPTADERFITLSTCDRGYAGTTGRYVVNLVLDQVLLKDGTTLTKDEYYNR